MKATQAQKRPEFTIKTTVYDPVKLSSVPIMSFFKYRRSIWTKLQHGLSLNMRSGKFSKIPEGSNVSRASITMPAWALAAWKVI